MNSVHHILLFSSFQWTSGQYKFPHARSHFLLHTHVCMHTHNSWSVMLSVLVTIMHNRRNADVNPILWHIICFSSFQWHGQVFWVPTQFPFPFGLKKAPSTHYCLTSHVSVSALITLQVCGQCLSSIPGILYFCKQERLSSYKIRFLISIPHFLIQWTPN